MDRLNGNGRWIGAIVGVIVIILTSVIPGLEELQAELQQIVYLIIAAILGDGLANIKQ